MQVVALVSSYICESNDLTTKIYSDPVPKNAWPTGRNRVQHDQVQTRHQYEQGTVASYFRLIFSYLFEDRAQKQVHVNKSNNNLFSDMIYRVGPDTRYPTGQL